MTIDQLLAEKWHWLTEANKEGFRVAATIGCVECGRRFIDQDGNIINEPLCPCSYANGVTELTCQQCVTASVERQRDTPFGRMLADKFKQIRAVEDGE